MDEKDEDREARKQPKKEKATSDKMALTLGNQVKRWLRWCTAGLRYTISCDIFRE